MPKHVAGRLQERVERLKEDPTVLIPECRHSGGCPWKGLERRLARVQRAGENREKLRRLSRRGPHLVRAYAGALDLLYSDTQGAFAAVPNPFGGAEVKYASRGNAKREVQAGIQNYTDRGLRLLAYLNQTRGFRGVYLFSTSAGLICTGRKPQPPSEFLADCAAEVSPTLSKSGEDFGCAHLGRLAKAPPRENDETHLAASWKTAKGALRVCRSCAGDENLSTVLRKYALGPKVDAQIDAWAELRPKCSEPGTEKCHFDERFALEEDERTSYLASKLTDDAVLDKVLKRALAEVDRRENGFVLAGGECLGNDPKAVIDQLKPEPEVRRALEAAFKGSSRTVVLDSLSASKLLAKFMDEKGEEILKAACGDAKVARRVLKEAKPTEAPSTLIQRAVRLARDRAIASELPSFEGLSAEAALADRAARAYRRGGAEGALKEIEAGRGQSPSAGSVAWAFLVALEKASGREWQFSKVEMERGAVAGDEARELLRCAGDDYARVLDELLKRVGVHEELRLKTT
jgi:hypothetical protein